MLNLIPELWQVCTNSYAIIFLRVPTPYLTNCFLSSLSDFLCTFLIILHMNVLIMNQSNHSTLLFLLSIPMIPLAFLKSFTFFNFFHIFFLYANPKKLTTTDGHEEVRNGRRPRTTGNQEGTRNSPHVLRTVGPVYQVLKINSCLRTHEVGRIAHRQLEDGRSVTNMIPLYFICCPV